MTTVITYRPFDLNTDAVELARLYSFTQPEPITTATVRDWWAPRKDEIRVTMLALDESQSPLGYWDVDRETWMRPGHYFIKVIVAPEARGQKLGAQLYAKALTCARERGATHLESAVREDDPISVSFAERRGFKIEYHMFESTLDLTMFDASRFADLQARIKAEGFRFFSLAEAGVTEENKHKLYEVNRACSLDSTGSDGTFSDYDAFSMNVFNASWFRADTQILAALGDEWVGLSAISISKEDLHSYNAFTGVMRAYRGRGLAQALKLETILLAQKEGMRYIRTNNESRNTPMLAINRKLGYKPEPGVYRILASV